MAGLLVLLFAVAQSSSSGLTDFSKEIQAASLAGTVRVVNLPQKTTGSGVIVKQSDPFVYILTADHLVGKGEGLEIHTFSPGSKSASIYRSVRVVARQEDDDLALLRLTTADRMPGSIRMCSPQRVPGGKNLAVLTAGCDGDTPTCVVDCLLGKKQVRRRPGGPATWVWEAEKAPAAGRSGGPLIDNRGYLLGVCSGASNNKGYFSHTEVIHRFLKDNGLKWLLEEE